MSFGWYHVLLSWLELIGRLVLLGLDGLRKSLQQVKVL
jgi:hypothetical protein